MTSIRNGVVRYVVPDHLSRQGEQIARPPVVRSLAHRVIEDHARSSGQVCCLSQTAAEFAGGILCSGPISAVGQSRSCPEANDAERLDPVPGLSCGGSQAGGNRSGRPTPCSLPGVDPRATCSGTSGPTCPPDFRTHLQPLVGYRNPGPVKCHDLPRSPRRSFYESVSRFCWRKQHDPNQPRKTWRRISSKAGPRSSNTPLLRARPAATRKARVTWGTG